MAMPALEDIYIQNCKLSCLPQGLASLNRCNLRTLYLYDLSILASVENFRSVVEFDVLYPRAEEDQWLLQVAEDLHRRLSEIGVAGGFPRAL